MGRRSINTTKSGKYMNPTDQARKEARKKELKKNKKQRQMVRQAVLKGKDPSQILEEMEKIDEMEYNVYQPSPLNEKVLKEKRKKLKEILDRVMRLYHADEPELWADMKRKEVEYEKKRFKLVQYYESVRTAEQVQIDDIPLPSSNDKPSSVPASLPVPAKISLPPPVLLTNVPPPSIIKKLDKSTPIEAKQIENKEKEPPGVPSGPPPDLYKMRELDSDYEDEESDSSMSDDDIPLPKAKITDDNSDENSESNTIQQKISSLSGNNIDDFMKEMENVQKKKAEERTMESIKIDPTPEVDLADKTIDIIEKPLVKAMTLEPAPIDPIIHKEVIPLPPTMPTMTMPRLPPLMFRPPPLRPGIPQMSLRMPAGPPPGRPNLSGMPRLGIRLPPGPPVGPPPTRHGGGGKHHNDRNNMQMHNPQMSKDPKSATITAKPQIRNLSADVTRFVPTTLRVKRDEIKKVKPKSFMHEQHIHQQPTSQINRGPTKDDAYMQFMNEMSELL